MSEHMHIHGPDVREEQLVDVYRARHGEQSPWMVISDQVMGGVSTGGLRQGERHGAVCTCLSGRTSLENNGGFLQMKLEIDPGLGCAEYVGMFIELCGAAHDYNLNVKTSQLEKPWQSFRTTLPVKPEWTRFLIPYAQLSPHRIDVEFAPEQIRSVAVIGIGEAFDVDVCVRRFGFYRS